MFKQNYQFVVTAKDGAPDPRIATATVSVVVMDVEDEVPIFKRAEYVASVPENMPDHFVAEVMVSAYTKLQSCRDKMYSSST